MTENPVTSHLLEARDAFERLNEIPPAEQMAALGVEELTLLAEIVHHAMAMLRARRALTLSETYQ